MVEQAKPLRVSGHAARYDTGNGVCVKPRCKCGWIGRAATPANARHLYRSHLWAVSAGDRAEGR
jgi:hypothetical protein